VTAEPNEEVLALDAGEPASKGKVLSWAIWDWGTQPYSTVIITFVFGGVYIISKAFGPPNYTASALALTTAIAGVLVAFLAPVLGQNSDRNSRTVRDWRIQTYLLILLSASLFFIKPAPAFLWPGLILLALGTVVNEISGVNYNAMLDEVAGQRNVGRVSGFGWGMGYLGGIVVMLILFVGFLGPDVGWFGVTAADGMNVRVSMLGCALWTLIFTIPTFIVLKDRHIPKPDRDNPWAGRRPAWLWRFFGIFRSVGVAYADLARSLRSLWRRSRGTVWFLLASALFRDGLNGIFVFGAVIASLSFGFEASEVIIFGAAANVLAGISTMLFGLLDDRIGPRRVILISLGALIALAATVFFLHGAVAEDQRKMVFWVAGLGLTLFVGPAQAASRSYLSRLIPQGKSGEIFGLYATTGRAVSFISPALFGAFVALGALLTRDENTTIWGIWGIIIVLVGGLVAMLFVKEHTETQNAFVKK